MKTPIASKLPDLEPSIFDVMNRVAVETGALNLAQGFPDFGVDPELIRLHSQALSDGHNQYAPLAGIFSLREAIVEKTESLYGAAYNPESEVTITAGATQALFTAIAASIRPGDEVIIFKPAYDHYEPSVRAHGGVPVLLQLDGPEFHIDWVALDLALSERTKMVILNTPHNPTGTVLSEADMKKLERRLSGTNILVLSDEVYEHLVYDGHSHQSVARFPGLRERAFICASFGKTFHITGWKTGYCLAPEPLMREFRKIHEFAIFCVSHPAQRALKTYLEKPEHYLELGDFMQRKRDLFLQAVSGSRFEFTPAAGTYFQLLSYGNLSNAPDREFAETLAREHGLASIPISVFNLDRQDHRQLRFCFAKKDDTLKRAGEILNGI
nr:methionine aminotransferase [Robiginitalea sp. SC105]